MSDKNRPGMGFEVNIRSGESDGSAPRVDGDTPFRIAVLGDFSGAFDQSAVNDKPLAERRLISIDRDNFDEVLAGFGLCFHIDLAGNTIAIEINALEDFHPDALYDRLEIFSKLRGIRRRLKDKKRFDEAAAEIMGWLVPEATDTPSQQNIAPRQPSQDVAQQGLLDSILDSNPQPSSDLEKAATPSAIDQLARAFAESHWDMRPAEASQTDRLPMYYYDDEGETVLMACAEIYLTEKGGNRLSNQGLMAVWSVRNMDAVRSSDFGSLATGNNLRGRWAG
jgi:type VI secretion system ImpB/VipA family protein